MLFSSADILQRIDETTLLYLCSAGALLLLRQAKTFEPEFLPDTPGPETNRKEALT